MSHWVLDSSSPDHHLPSRASLSLHSCLQPLTWTGRGRAMEAWSEVTGPTLGSEASAYRTGLSVAAPGSPLPTSTVTNYPPTLGGFPYLLVVGHPRFLSPSSSAWMRAFSHPPLSVGQRPSPRDRCFLLALLTGRKRRENSFGLPLCLSLTYAVQLGPPVKKVYLLN